MIKKYIYFDLLRIYLIIFYKNNKMQEKNINKINNILLSIYILIRAFYLRQNNKKFKNQSFSSFM